MPVTASATTAPALPTQVLPQDTGFNVAGCIVSFLITFGIAATVGLAVPFVVWLITTGVLTSIGLRFNEAGNVSFYCTGVTYLALFGVIWWALYKVISRK